MNKHDEEPQYKKYDFNSEETRRRQRKKNYSGWWFALLVLIVALAIALSVSWFLTKNNSQSHSHHSANPIGRTIKKSESTLEKKDPKGALTSKLEKNRVTAFSSSLQKANRNGITRQQRAKFQNTINREQNKTVKSQEQTLLNKVKQRRPSPKGPKTSDQFTSDHTFASIQDAKNWANATKQQWLKAGYVNYTITSNGQGYYTLKFIKG